MVRGGQSKERGGARTQAGQGNVREWEAGRKSGREEEDEGMEVGPHYARVEGGKGEEGEERGREGG